MEGLDEALKGLFSNIDKLKSQLTPEQKAEVSKFQSETNKFFKGIDFSGPMKIDLKELEKRQKNIQKLAKKWQY